MGTTERADVETANIETANLSERPSTLFTRPFLRLLAVQCCFGMSFSTFFLVPKFLAADLGASPAAIGVVSAAYGVAGLVAIPILGVGLDRIDRRIFFRAGGGLMVVAAFAFLFVDRLGPLPVLLRFLQGLAWTTVFSSGLALASDIAPRGRVAEAIGLVGASNLVTSALAPALAEPLADAAGYRVVFALATAAAVASLALSFHMVAAPTSPRRPTPSLASFFGRPIIWGMAAIIGTAGMGFGVMFSFYEPFALASGIERVGGFFVAYSVGAFFVRVVLGRYVDRVGARPVAVCALGLYTLAIVGMQTMTPLRLVTFAGLFGVAHGFFFPSINALLLQVAGPRERGRAIALSNGIFNGGSTSVLGFGYAIEHVGYAGVFRMAAAATAIAALVLVAWSPAPSQRSQRA